MASKRFPKNSTIGIVLLITVVVVFVGALVVFGMP